MFPIPLIILTQPLVAHKELDFEKPLLLIEYLFRSRNSFRFFFSLHYCKPCRMPLGEVGSGGERWWALGGRLNCLRHEILLEYV